MWPDSKGKGGREGSPKSKDGGGEASKPSAGASGSSSGGKSGGKGRNTKTKMKALQAEAANQQDAAQAAAKLEADIMKAAQNLSPGHAKAEETKTLIEVNRVPESAVNAPSPEAGSNANLMRLPQSSNENIDDKISSLWKSRVLGAYRANPRASQHILPAMPNNRGALEITDKARCDAQQAAMITLIDKMFDTFQSLAFEFNDMAQASDLELTWIRPVISRENISSWHQAAQVISVFTGRISTRKWTMVVRGTLDSVLAYVIPADKLLSFSNQPSNFQPVIELVPTATGLTVRWSTFGRDVSAEELGHIYRALLDNMIQIAQDGASCDQLIDLPAYGVVLGGDISAPAQDFNQPSNAMGQDLNYGAKYQQVFKDDATSTELPAAQMAPAAGQISSPFSRPPGQAPGLPQMPSDSYGSAQSFGSAGGGGADWKPVVHSVRGANPPVPPTPIPGQVDQSAMPSVPGFNQDEPWKYGSGTIPGGPSNPSINSMNARSGSGAFAGGPGGANFGRVPGDQNDEPPLPSLPAHLFEGLPPRPQNIPGTSFSQSSAGAAAAQASQSSPSSYQGQPSPWAPPQPPANNSGVSSTSASSSSPSAASDGWKVAGSTGDGWKSAGIPASKGMTLPPLPVSNYQTPRNSAFGEPLPLNNSLVSPESFSSGSIRVDAIAREIAHSPVDLPPAVPGFEPYSVNEPKGDPSRSRAETQPLSSPLLQRPQDISFNQPDPVQEDDEPDDLDDPDAELKPWPKPRPRAIVEPEPELDVEAQPMPQPIPQQMHQPVPQPMPQFMQQPMQQASQTTIPPVTAGPGGDQSISAADEQNAFINFEIQLPTKGPTPQPPEADDPEIAALFEGEPVNASDAREQSAKPKAAGSEPAYMAWLEPEPRAAVDSAPPETDQSWRSENSNITDTADTEVIEESPPWKQEEALGTGQQPQSDSGSMEAAAAERAKTGEHSRAAIEEGFRQAQAAIAAAQMQQAPLDQPVIDQPVIDQPVIDQPVIDQPAMDQSAPAAGTPSFEPAMAQEQTSVVEPALAAAPAPFAEAPSFVASAPPAVSSFSDPGAASIPSFGASAAAGASLKADMERLMVTLDKELEVISAKGSEAFARRDLKGAERMIKLAETLGEFKDALTKLKDEHGQDLS